MHVSIAPEALFQIGPLTVTNSMLTAFLSSIIVGVTFVWAARRVTLKPAGGFAGGVEAVASAVIDQGEQVFGNRKDALYYFPLICTFFLFILVSNWVGLIPGFNTLQVGDVPVFRSVSADLNTTLALALISVILTQVYAVQKLGVVGNLKRYFSKNPAMNLLGLLEIVLELMRVISFSFRLFGNIFAGEVLLIVISSLLPVLGPTPFWGMELFVGAIQALVFAMLTMVFIAMATTPTEH